MREEEAAPSTPSFDPAFAFQVLLAVTLPWLAGRWLDTNQTAWAVVVVAGVLVFSWPNRTVRTIWLLPISAVVSLLPVLVPAAPSAGGIPAAVLAMGSALAVIASRRRAPTPAASQRALGAVGVALLLTGLLTGLLALEAVRSSDREFAIGQAAAAEAWAEPWDAPLISAAQDAAVPASAGAGSYPGTATGTAEPPQAVLRTPPLATIAFRRPGSTVVPVADQVFYVGSDVTMDVLAAGPGHYPSTSGPGRPGNFAVAGHRTGWGSPFLHLDELRTGDEVVVTARTGRRYVYVVDRTELVEPDAAWVLGRDPLGSGTPTLTLTTCDPPHTDDHRMVVFATLNGRP